jgi:hypothetical protein
MADRLRGGRLAIARERAMLHKIVLLMLPESDSDTLRPLQRLRKLSMRVPAMASFSAGGDGDHEGPPSPYPLIAEYTLPSGVEYAWGADPFVASDGRRLLPVAQQSQGVGLYDLETGAVVGFEWELEFYPNGPLACCHVYPAADGTLRLAAGGWCQEVVIYSLEPDTLMKGLHNVPTGRMSRNPVWCIQSYAGPEGEGRRLVLLGGSGSFQILCGETGEHIRDVGRDDGAGRNVVTFRDDHDRPRVLCAGMRCALEVYDPESGELVMRTGGVESPMGGPLGRTTAITIVDPGPDPTTGEPALHAVTALTNGRVQVKNLKGGYV